MDDTSAGEKNYLTTRLSWHLYYPTFVMDIEANYKKQTGA